MFGKGDHETQPSGLNGNYGNDGSDRVETMSYQVSVNDKACNNQTYKTLKIIVVNSSF